MSAPGVKSKAAAWLQWLSRPGMRLPSFLVAGALLLVVLHLLVRQVSGVALWQTLPGSVLVTVYATGAVFGILLLAVRRALSVGLTPFAVAGTVLDEAVRRRVVAAYIALVLVVIPIMPMMIGSGQALRFRVQTFLSFSLGATFFLLSLMTVFLACAGMSMDISNRQVFHSMVKPVGRGAYLVGKWLGLVLLIGMLLAAAGTATYVGALQMASQTATGPADRRAIEEEILVARRSVQPNRPEDLEARIRQRVENIRQTGQEVSEEEIEDIYHEERLRAVQLKPGERKTLVFDGLPPGTAPTLRFLFYPGGGTPRRPLKLQFGDKQLPLQEYPGRKAHLISIPPDAVSDEGRLQVTVSTPGSFQEAGGRAVGTVQFDPRHLEVLYKAGGFGGNFIRTLLVLWLKLAFLAMLGVSAGAMLSFPVAALASLVVLLAVSMAPYLMDVETGHSHGAPVVVSAVESGLKRMAQGISLLVSRWGNLAPTSELVDGRLVSWPFVLRAVFWVGLLWTGAAGAVGYVIFRRRELARVQV